MFRHRFVALLCTVLLVTSHVVAAAPDASTPDASTKALLGQATKQIGVTLSYDPNYRQLGYPMGDVPRSTGVCTDVVIRAYRDAFGIDLQQRVHEDMRANFKQYPRKWGLKKPDRNIDHRRVPNLMTFLTRQQASLPISKIASDYQAGDIVTWDLGGGITHIGLVDQTATADARPLIIHNIGAGTQREDLLFEYKIIGHYRWLPIDAPAPTRGSQ
ncbi:DUF1287 domain-containing protein [Ahniella affigens]|uniref:DUF1287 domain-containing protein n=1 Tax=Ahniella affigens TaxID=2021234 RepID=A0A2P1PU04_9GAMM|nr:DUF1287 domain-containing protein [Ahniella affigens]AVP98323.1 DUF1287 domain-containing protein [Ahniella affigens]